MSQLAPFRITISPTLPTADREALLATLQTQAQVQVAEQKDPTVDAIVAIVKQAGDLSGAVVNIVTLATMIYSSAQALRKRGIIPEITLFRPDQPELNLSHVQSAEEIEAWLRHVTR